MADEILGSQTKILGRDRPVHTEKAMSSLVDPSCREHIMLLYGSEVERNQNAVDYINEGLRRAQLAVYASVNASDTKHMSRISSGIMDYEENVENGNLFILRLESFYRRALVGDLEPFNDFKAPLEEIVKERTAVGRSCEVVVVADCADNLSRNKKFEECIHVERWWQDAHHQWLKKGQKITVICPHPRSVLEKRQFATHKRLISHEHSLTLAAQTK